MKGENCPGHPLCQAPTIDTWKKQRAENHRKPREGPTELPGANSYNISWSYKAVPTNGPYGPYKALYGNPVISDNIGIVQSHPEMKVMLEEVDAALGTMALVSSYPLLCGDLFDDYSSKR